MRRLPSIPRPPLPSAICALVVAGPDPSQSGRCEQNRRRVAGLLAALWLILPGTGAADQADAGDCVSAHQPATHLMIVTDQGTMTLELYDDAAPATVRRLLELVAGDDHRPGHYDGLSFDFTQPRGEIRTAEPLSDVGDFSLELDAAALGLDSAVISTLSEAMVVIQDELLAAFRGDKRGQSLSPQLRDWLAAWFDSYDPRFLLGVSRQQVNEALGYRYTDGLASRPVTRGSVALVPRGPSVASPRLSIALRDMPRRTGRWMVIGRIVEGLDLADAISMAPLEHPRHIKPRGYIPRQAVVIRTIEPSCFSDPASATPIDESMEENDDENA